MKKTIQALNREWPDTGRTWPDGAKLDIRSISPRWLDLAWWSEKQDAFIYISTLPNPDFSLDIS